MPKSITTSDLSELISRQLDSACHDTFDSYGAPVERVDGPQGYPPADEHLDGAVIGFTGDSLRGALVLLAPVDVVRAWRSGEGDLVDDDLHDTIAEFSNMLLGRVKSGLLGEGIELQMSTPTGFCATRAILPVVPPVHSTWHHFSGAAGAIHIRVDALVDGVCITADDGPEEAPAAAGEMLLF